eukprot:9625482-Alexandrium_andersonii.AAC.1
MALTPGLLFLVSVAFAARSVACVPDVPVGVGSLDAVCPAHAAGYDISVPYSFLLYNYYRVPESGSLEMGGPTPEHTCHVDKGTHATTRAP